MKYARANQEVVEAGAEPIIIFLEQLCGCSLTRCVGESDSISGGCSLTKWIGESDTTREFFWTLSRQMGW